MLLDSTAFIVDIDDDGQPELTDWLQPVLGRVHQRSFAPFRFGVAILEVAAVAATAAATITATTAVVGVRRILRECSGAGDRLRIGFFSGGLSASIMVVKSTVYQFGLILPVLASPLSVPIPNTPSPSPPPVRRSPSTQRPHTACPRYSPSVSLSRA